MILSAKPCTLKQANELVDKLHRHHKPVTGHRFSISAWYGDMLVGVCIVGRPVAKGTNQYEVAEVTRLVTDGTRNACSFLYSRAARAAEAMGFRSIQTFILASEPGTSLRASGWELVATLKARTDPGWNSRDSRAADQNGVAKTKWERRFND